MLQWKLFQCSQAKGSVTCPKQATSTHCILLCSQTTDPLATCTCGRCLCVCTCKEPYKDLHCELKQSRHLSNWRQSQSCSGGGGFDTVWRTATRKNQGGRVHRYEYTCTVLRIRKSQPDKLNKERQLKIKRGNVSTGDVTGGKNMHVLCMPQEHAVRRSD